jgi:hypothetical protein
MVATVGVTTRSCQLWRNVAADPALGPELQHFSDAVQRRFGDGLAETPSVPREHRAALAAASRTVRTLKQGEYADISEVVQERLAHRRELGLWRGISR